MTTDKEIRELVAQSRHLGAIIRTRSEGGDGHGGGDTIVEIMIRSGVKNAGPNWMPVIQAAEILRRFISMELDMEGYGTGIDCDGRQMKGGA